ncbi:hemolysin family protein [Aquisalibacillus elongatus]|uniref:CBS domain containing-hemolysin-like protein n=1 Tax=Aquisalibacillus elongatus TaxID=485577 RepID=A0A3N5B862_9BACI|nr:hemolysin family protein [Aquisalibacillus elongatus]RPF53219.1 CBS domain containing-hemolysin-like protein [Aquisalibacillus elongatus]
MTGETIGYILLIILLIALTAFFVASEFAIVKVRSSKVEHLVEQGDKRAIATQKIVDELDAYLSACQLGITITALGLGWIGEPTVERLLRPVFHYIEIPTSLSHFLSFIFAFIIITFLHVVIGELAPKTFAIQLTEKVALFTARPLIWFYRLMFPFIWLLNGSARLLTRMFGVSPASEHEIAHSEEELRIILSESYQSGEINQAEYKYVNRIFEFDNRLAKEIMVPRMQIEAFEIDATIQEFLNRVRDVTFTRYPVIEGDHDHIVGMINVKRVLTNFLDIQDFEYETIEPFVRPVIRVIETIPIEELLKKMQVEHIHMAVLVDEYGGTSGIVTVEDILEEIVGDIQDEFDEEEEVMFVEIERNVYIVDGRALVSEINDWFDLDIEAVDVDTVGGWLLTEKHDLKQGDTVQYQNVHFEVKEMDGYTVRKVEVSR